MIILKLSLHFDVFQLIIVNHSIANLNINADKIFQWSYFPTIFDMSDTFRNDTHVLLAENVKYQHMLWLIVPTIMYKYHNGSILRILGSSVFNVGEKDTGSI